MNGRVRGVVEVLGTRAFGDLRGMWGLVHFGSLRVTGTCDRTVQGCCLVFM